MQQVEFTLSEPLADFLNDCRQYGFEDQSAMVEAALLHLQRDIEQRQLHESAALYAELYAKDGELQELTVNALDAWPE